MKKYSAFSLLEISIVILVVGILIAGFLQGGKAIKQAKLRAARALTQSSPVIGMSDYLVAWFETSLDSSFTETEGRDGLEISTWYDNNSQPHNGKNSATGSSTTRPKFYENVFNDAIPAIRFDGSDDLLTFDGTPLVGVSGFSIFVVEQRRSANSDWSSFFGGTSSTSNGNVMVAYNTNTTVAFSTYGSNITYAVSGYTTPTPRIHCFTFSTATGKTAYLNGTSKTSNSSQTTALISYAGAALGRFVNGGSSLYFNGDLGEVIILSRIVNTEERKAIEAYLSKKHGIKVT